MTRTEANALLNRIKEGDKTPTQSEIRQALKLTGDL